MLNLAPVSRTSPAGTRVYKRSIAFVLGAATQRMSLGPVVVMESIGASFHFRLPNAPLNQETADALSGAIRALIGECVPIVKRSVPRGLAIAHFTARQSEHTLALVKATCEEAISCHVCDAGNGQGEFMSLAHSPVVPNTKFVDPAHFAIDIVNEPFPHFRLHHAVTCVKTGSFGLNRCQEIILTQAYAIRKAWGGQLQLNTVTSVNAAIAANRVKSVVQLSEALHDQQIVSIATRIAGAPGEVSTTTRPRLVLIAGPSSSGKTTFAKRLGVALETLGALPVVISVDCYYKAWTEIDSRGMKFVDWESLQSLNLDLLNENLLDLLAGKEVLIPEYDMKTSMPMAREHWTPTKLPAGGIIIIEGIHGLNPQLTARIPRENKFQLMISPLSALVLDDMNIVSSTQVRMLRRMVRDYLFRGRSAKATLSQWPAVALGERVNIYPNQNHADAVMNSGLVYEAHVLKVFAEPLLRSITPEMDEYAEARRLLSMLDRLVTMSAELVPPQSLLREFIGGSWFYDFGGLYKNA